MAKRSLKKPESYDGSAVESYLREIFAEDGKTYSQDHLADAMKVDSRHVAGRYVRGDYKDRHWTARHIENILHYLNLPQDGEEKERLYALITAQTAHDATQATTTDAAFNINLQDANIGRDVIFEGNNIYMGVPSDNSSDISNLSCYLPPFTAEYYYELQLAEPAPKKQDNDEEDKYIPHEIRHLSENINNHETNSWHKPKPASQRFSTIANNYGDAVHIILGEPGGGKTTLLSKWAHDAYAAYQKDDAQPFPIYMRLRELGNPDDKNAALAAYYKRLTSDTINIQPFLEKAAKALWLFDGWDELAEESRANWAQYISSLAGQKIVSCRVLRYQDDFGATAKRYLIYGLNRAQQKEYLQKIVPQLQEVSQPHHNADEAWVDELLRRLHSQEHSRLRQLAISPLLLKLIADTNPPNNIKLPNTRTQFYDDAITNLLNREYRLHSETLEDVEIEEFKDVLANIARHAGIGLFFSGRVVAKALREVNAPKGTQSKLKKCGILRDVGKNYEFLHATFQEWALAHHLAQQENLLVNAVQAYWRDPRYNEVIALLWAYDVVDDAQREAATRFLIDAGCQEQVGNMRRRRSGLKQSVAFWDAAGMQMPEALANDLWARLQHKAELRIALAVAETQQDGFIRLLAKDEDSGVRWSLAANLNLGAEVMVQLAEDEDSDVRRRLAANPNLAAEVMGQLAGDEDNYVRGRLAANPNLGVEVMGQLARDKDNYVRGRLAANPNLAAEVMVQLAGNEDSDVRGRLAANPNLTAEVMGQLVGNGDRYVRRRLAENPNLAAEVIVQLAGDEDSDVRRRLAENPNLAAEVIVQLAGDEDSDVRWSLAANPNLAAEVMVQLAGDEDRYVRRRLAANPNLAAEVMVQLAGDEDSDVRWRIAENPNLAAEVMVQLAGDEYISVRGRLAENPNLAAEVMVQLAGDEDSDVRWSLASNPKVCWEVFLT